MPTDHRQIGVQNKSGRSARILFVAAHRPDRSPSQRYRFEQYAPYWRSKGWDSEYAWLIDAEDDRYFYSKGKLVQKGLFFLRSWKRRRAHVAMASEFDIVFVQREAFMTGSTRFERAFKRSGAKVVFDFDDAIWHMDVSDGNRYLRWLKKPAKTAELVAMADHVIAGNAYLAEYAGTHNAHVSLFPTVIDTDLYQPLQRPDDGRVVIGWTGSKTSVAHLKQALPALREVQRKYGDRVRFRIISDGVFVDQQLSVENLLWKSSTEVEDLNAIDIGIMPLPHNEWSRGKCGFKGLQYMGLGKAVVLDNIGVNSTIVQDGVNGFLASTDNEWVEKISRLVEDRDLRHRLGTEARRTVVRDYSVQAWRDKYLDLFNSLIGSR